MNIEKRIAKAILENIKPSFANGDDFTSIYIDETDINFEELARIAIAEIVKGATGCGVCGCLVYPDLPTKRS
jgi:hypothetical protein